MTINHIISEYGKLVRKNYTTIDDSLEKLILKLCKELGFDNTNKWYTQNPEFVLEN